MYTLTVTETGTKRKKTGKSGKLPLDISRIVDALCNDYDRRTLEILRGKKDDAVLSAYRALNDSIDAALEETCEIGIRDDMRRDIGLCRGHRMSPIICLSPKTFKARKRDAKQKIAEKLHLI